MRGNDLAEKGAAAAVTRLLLAPALPSAEDVLGLLPQLLWHFQGSFAHVARIVVPCGFALPAGGPAEWLERHAPPFLADVDPAAVALLRRFADRVLCEPHAEGDPVGDHPGAIVLFWRDFPGRPESAARVEALGGRWHLLGRLIGREVSTGLPVEGGLVPAAQLLAAAWQAEPDRIGWIRESECRFQDQLRRHGQGRRVLVCGNGPSASRLDPACHSADLVVHCNHTVLNSGLLDRVPPAFLAVYDDELWGCRAWSSEFRRAVAPALERHGTRLLVPMFAAPLVRCLLGDGLADRIIGIPYSHEQELPNDLLRRFWLNSTNNVLTAMMLPVARAFAEGGGEIAVLGCDGRPFDLDAVDWPHAVPAPHGRQAPSGTGINFSPYDFREVMLHYLWTADRIAAIEAAGVPVRCVAPSHVPALMERFDARPR